MYVRKIPYTDFLGNKREDEFYFNLNKAEVIKWLTTSGDYTLDKVLHKVAKERNGKQIIEIFEEMLKMSYGKPSLDGIKFEKSDEIWDDFYRSDAYSELFTELVTDAAKAAEFLNKIIPKDLAEEVDKTIRSNPNLIPEEVKGAIAPTVVE